jgi:hypothetical protein
VSGTTSLSWLTESIRAVTAAVWSSRAVKRMDLIRWASQRVFMGKGRGLTHVDMTVGPGGVGRTDGTSDGGEDNEKTDEEDSLLVHHLRNRQLFANNSLFNALT